MHLGLVSSGQWDHSLGCTTDGLSKAVPDPADVHVTFTLSTHRGGLQEGVTFASVLFHFLLKGNESYLRVKNKPSQGCLRGFCEQRLD